MSSPLLPRRAVAVLAVALSLCAAIRGQASKQPMPEELAPFWQEYAEALTLEDEGEVDRVVRKSSSLAERTLNYLIERYCLSPQEDYELEGDLRQMARALDRVLGGEEKYTARVRGVVGLAPGDRRRRVAALKQFYEGNDAFRASRFDRDAERLAKAEQLLSEAAGALESLGDEEYALYCEYVAADVCRLGERFEAARVHLEKVVALGADLDYTEPLVESAAGLLADMERLERGEPEGVGGGDVTVPGGAAASPLDRFAEGSAQIDVALTPIVPKKGLPPAQLPTLTPHEQFFTWTVTTIQGSGPTAFDSLRGERLQPFGRAWLLSRDGTEFSLDVDGDGTPEVTFAPTSQPTRLDVPDPAGGAPYPLMVAIPSDKESQFGVDVNYSPQIEFARLRFNVGGYAEGEVLGETWLLFDTNLTGRYGDVGETYDDLVTKYDPDAEAPLFHEPDAVLVGKAKKAVPWSSVLDVNGTFYRANVDPRGGSLALRELDIETGFVKLDAGTAVKPSFLIVREIGELAGAFFDLVPEKRGGAVELPVGTYQVCLGRIDQGSKTSMKTVRIYGRGSEPFTVTAGETHVLGLGPPFTLTFDPPRQEDEETVLDTRSIRIFGRGGEEYAMLYDAALQPEVSVQTLADERKIEKGTKLRLPGIEEWQNNTGQDNVLWFPVEHRVENGKREKLQFRLEQKSHKLLGGPFDSGWLPPSDGGSSD